MLWLCFERLRLVSLDFEEGFLYKFFLDLDLDLDKEPLDLESELFNFFFLTVD